MWLRTLSNKNIAINKQKKINYIKLNNLISIRLAIKKRHFLGKNLISFSFYFSLKKYYQNHEYFSSVNIIEVPFGIFTRMKYKIFFAIWILIQIFVLNSTSLALTFKDNHCLACFKPTPLSYFFLLFLFFYFGWSSPLYIEYNSKALHMSKNIEHRR